MGNFLTKKKPISTHDTIDVPNELNKTNVSNELNRPTAPNLKKVEKEKIFNIAIKNSHTSMMLLMSVKYFYTIKDIKEKIVNENMSNNDWPKYLSHFCLMYNDNILKDTSLIDDCNNPNSPYIPTLYLVNIETGPNTVRGILRANELIRGRNYDLIRLYDNYNKEDLNIVYNNDVKYRMFLGKLIKDYNYERCVWNDWSNWQDEIEFEMRIPNGYNSVIDRFIEVTPPPLPINRNKCRCYN